MKSLSKARILSPPSHKEWISCWTNYALLDTESLIINCCDTNFSVQGGEILLCFPSVHY